MKYIAIFLFILAPNLAHSCMCEFGCLNDYTDIVAEVEVLDPSGTYPGAFDAKVLRLEDKHLSAKMDKDMKLAFQDNSIDLITISDVGIHEKDTSESNNVGTVFVSSCGVGLRPGEKYYFFGKYVAPNVYETSQCSCTIWLK